MDACAAMSRFPIAVVVKSLNTVSLSPSIPVVQDGSTLIFPPALKKCLILSAFANVTDLSIVDVSLNVPPLVVDPTAFVPKAVADVDPAATSAANDAKSATTADFTAISSPAATAVLAVSESLTWFPMLVIPVKSALNCAAVIVVAPPVTVCISVCPKPYTPEPVPAK